MSTPTTVQSNLVPIAISVDGTTYKNLVCKKSWGFKGTTPTSIEQTDCGPLVGLGSNEWSFDAEIVLNRTPAGASEVSAKELADIWNNQTPAFMKVVYPGSDGTTFFLQGAGFITAFNLTNTVGSLMTATVTFSGNGTVDNTF